MRIGVKFMSFPTSDPKSSHNRRVIEYVGWIVLTLVAAAGVLVTAAVVSNDRDSAGRGLSGFLADVRAGLHDLFDRSTENAVASPGTIGVSPIVSIEPEDAFDLTDFFAAQEHTGQGYMQAEEITATLDRARTVIRTHTPAARARNTGLPISHATAPRPRRASGVSGHVSTGSNRVGRPQ